MTFLFGPPFLYIYTEYIYRFSLCVDYYLLLELNLLAIYPLHFSQLLLLLFPLSPFIPLSSFLPLLLIYFHSCCVHRNRKHAISVNCKTKLCSKQQRFFPFSRQLQNEENKRIRIVVILYLEYCALNKLHSVGKHVQSMYYVYIFNIP